MAYFVGYNPTIEHAGTAGFYLVNQLSQGSTQPGDTPTRVFLTATEEQFVALKAAQVWDDGIPCYAYVHPETVAALSEPDARPRFRLEYGGVKSVAAVACTQDVNAGKLTIARVDAKGAVIDVDEVHDIEIGNGHPLRIVLVKGEAVVDVGTENPGVVEIRSDRTQRIEPDGRFALTIYQTVLRAH